MAIMTCLQCSENTYFTGIGVAVADFLICCQLWEQCEVVRAVQLCRSRGFHLYH